MSGLVQYVMRQLANKTRKASVLLSLICAVIVSLQCAVFLKEDDDANSAVGYREPVHQAQKLKELPTLDDERFNHAVAAVESGKFPKMRLLTEYALTDEQKRIAGAL